MEGPAGRVPRTGQRLAWCFSGATWGERKKCAVALGHKSWTEEFGKHLSLLRNLKIYTHEDDFSCFNHISVELSHLKIFNGEY